MRNKIIAIIISLLLLSSLSASIISAESEGRLLERVEDTAGLLTDDEYYGLLEKLDEISERQMCDVVIITVEELDEGYTPTEFADDVFDYYGFGIGENRDGILLLISMEERDWAISTRGYGITAFTDAGQEYIIDMIIDDLGNNNYASAFNTFAEQCDEFLTQAKTGEPFDINNLPGSARAHLTEFFLCAVLGISMGIAIANSMKSKLKTVKAAVSAGNYTVKDSLNLVSSSDTFITRRVTRSVRQSSSSDDSGGSSTHTSSSGATHGGSSGKF